MAGSGADGAQLAPGTLFEGRYRVLRPIGRGGVGVVYEARDEAPGTATTGRAVALKLLRRASDAVDEFDVRGLAVEFSLLARLRHPNLVAVHRFAVAADGRPYLVAEHVDGPTLGPAMVGRHPGDLLWIASGVLLALDHLHRHGYVHQDVKPSNILCAGAADAAADVESWTIKVGDLGAAAVRGSDAGHVVGTLDYLAPERLHGAPANAASDLWALGVTLWACATGRVPIHADSLEEARGRLLTGRIPPLRDACSSAPVELERLIAAMLARDPRDRFADAGSALVELGRLLRRSDRAVPPPPIDAMVENARLCGRASVVAAALAIIAAHTARGPRAAAVLGPSGSGRTRVLREIGLEAEMAGAHVVTVEAGPGLRPWHHVLSQLAAEPPPRRLTASGIADALARVLASRPAVVVCDDLHRRDRVATHVIERVAALLEDVALPHVGGIVVASDPTARTGWRPRDRRAFAALTLAPLDEPAIAELCASVLGSDPPRALVDLTARQAGGLPRLAIETLRALLHQGALHRVAASWELAAASDGLVAGAHHRRLAALDATTRRLLETLAMFGPAGTVVPLVVATDVAEIPSGEAARVIEAALSTQLVRLRPAGIAAGSGLAHTSEAVRSACEAEVPPDRRAELHARAYAALRDRGADAAAVCHHALGAGRRGEAARLALAAARDAEEVGDAATVLQVVEIGERAVEDAGSPEARTLGHMRTRALLRLGRPGDAEVHARALIAQTPADHDASLLCAEALVAEGDGARALHLLSEIEARCAAEQVPVPPGLDVCRIEAVRLVKGPRDALALADAILAAMTADDGRDSARRRADVHVAAGQAALGLRDFDRARTELERGLELHHRVDNVTGMARAECYLAATCDLSGDSDGATRHVARGLVHAVRAGSDGDIARLINVRAILHAWKGEQDHAAEAFLEAERRGRLAGIAKVVSAASGNRAMVHRRQGLFGRSLDAARRSLEIKHEQGDRVGVLTTLLNLSDVWRELGAFGPAAAAARRAVRGGRALGQDWIHAMGHLSLAMAAADGGDVPAAIAALAELERIGGGVEERNRVETQIVRAKVLDGDGRRHAAVELARACVTEAEAENDVYNVAWASLELGAFLEEAGLDHLRRAAETAARASARSLEWVARARIGQLLGAGGGVRASRLELVRGAEILDEIVLDLPARHRARYLAVPGRRRWVDAVRAVDRSVGDDVPPPAPDSVTTSTGGRRRT